MLLTFDFAPAPDKLVELIDFTGIEAERKAQLPQIALGAGCLDLYRSYGHYRFHLHAQSPELRGHSKVWSPLIHVNTIF
ncbi:hypothetical protein [Zoogloea sp.]|uniref:hypothetical protein n=1 Tax=Zoogloea sp. TaxID=49181 RepID=UPI0035B04477